MRTNKTTHIKGLQTATAFVIAVAVVYTILVIATVRYAKQIQPDSVEKRAELKAINGYVPNIIYAY